MNNIRKTEYEINELFLNRCSSRALSDNVSKKEIMELFEAARWSPSASNIQPWRFYYAMKNTPVWNDFFGLLVEFNQIWAKNAAALIIIVSKKTNATGEYNPTHSFDTGAAWMSLALQASLNEIVAHAMAGFDYEKAKQILGLPGDYSVEAMVAIGRKGSIDVLPERMQKGEKFSDRIPIKDFVFEGKYNKSSK